MQKKVTSAKSFVATDPLYNKKQSLEVFCKKTFLKNFSKLTAKHLVNHLTPDTIKTQLKNLFRQLTIGNSKYLKRHSHGKSKNFVNMLTSARFSY